VAVVDINKRQIDTTMRMIEILNIEQILWFAVLSEGNAFHLGIHFNHA